MFNHPDLKGNMWINEGEKLYADTDKDGNGYKDDVYGYNFVNNTGIISWMEAEDSGHGTHVAGTIAAMNGNNEGVCGIAGGDGPENPGVRIMSYQVFSGINGVTLDAEARAIKYAADNGAVILQCSWGYNSSLANMIEGYSPGPGSEEEWENMYPLEKEALDYFVNNAGSPNGVIDGGLAIFAAGNEYAGMAAFPAAYSKCVSVSAVAADFTPASYSNYGEEVTISAPVVIRNIIIRWGRMILKVGRMEYIPVLFFLHGYRMVRLHTDSWMVRLWLVRMYRELQRWDCHTLTSNVVISRLVNMWNCLRHQRSR